MTFRNDEASEPFYLGEQSGEASFRVDEGYSDETRPQVWTDSSSRQIPDHPSDLILPDSITALSEPQRSELAYAILRSIRTSSVAAIVERLTPLLHLNPVAHLPVELILQIFSYLDPQTLLNAAVISRCWRERALEPRLWRGLYLREGWRADLVAVALFEDMLATTKPFRTKALRRMNHQKNRPSLLLGSPSSDRDEWRNQHDNVEADDQVMEDPQSQGAGGEDFVMRDVEGSPQRGAKSVFGTNVSLELQDSSSADEDEMYPSPPVSRRQVSEGRDDLQSSQSSGKSAAVREELVASSVSGASKINWQYLYKQRKKLEDNWSGGRFVNFQLPHPDYPQEGHKECIYTIQYSGKYLVSGSRDQSVRIWDLDTRRLVLKPLLGHRMSVLCLQFDASAEEDIIISGSSDTDVILWRFSTGEIIQRIIRAHRESVLNLRFDKRFLITCSRDKTIRIWSRKSLQADSPEFPKPSQPWGSEPGKFPTHIIDMVQQPSLGPQPLPPYSLLMTLSGHGAAVNAIQVHGDKIVSASGDRSIKVWDVITGDVIRTINAHSKGIACVQFDGKRIVSGSSDWTVRIFDCETAAEIGNLRGHRWLVRTVQAGFGDIPGSAEDDLSEARSLDRDLLTGVYNGTLPDFHARVRGPRNAGSKNAANMTAYGASLPPGGGGSKWGRIVSGSYDETVIIWKRDPDGSWVVGHRLRQADAARQASGEFHPEDPSAPQNNPPQNNDGPAPDNANVPQANDTATPTAMPPAPGPVNPALAAAAAAAINVPNGGAGGAGPAVPNPAPPQPQHAPALLPVPQTLNHPNHINVHVHPNGAITATPPAGQGSGNSRVFKLQFDARRIICCSQDPRIVGWDFANGDSDIEEVSKFFIGC